jgi:hypothetical protein
MKKYEDTATPRYRPQRNPLSRLNPPPSLKGGTSRLTTIQVGLFTQWLQAESLGDDQRAEYLAGVFPEPLAGAFTAWVAADPQANPDVPRTPFAMPEYAIPEEAGAAAADAGADGKFTDALGFNQRSDDYTRLTVLFAAVLFFGSLSGRGALAQCPERLPRTGRGADAVRHRLRDLLPEARVSPRARRFQPARPLLIRSTPNTRNRTAMTASLCAASQPLSSLSVVLALSPPRR